MNARSPARSAVFFFVATFVVTWGLQLPAWLASLGVISGPFERFAPLLGLSAFGPMFGAMLAARREGGRGSIRALFRPLKQWRVGAAWYVIALASSGGIFVVGMAVYSAVGGHAGPWLYVPHTAETITAMFVFSFGEEIGWRGFALPRLQERYGATIAAIIVGLGWGLWHLPMFQMSHISLSIMGLVVPFMVAGSVIFTWIYNRTRGSLLIAVLAHMGAHLNNSNKALPGHVDAVVVHTVALGVVALAIIVFDRRAMRAHAPL